MQKLVLIDGNAIVHRAFHALPPLTSKDGQLTNAVYGFISMLFKILDETKPEFLVVCFDRPKPTFRQALYAGYQQHRPKMSEELVPQIALLHEVLNNMKACIFEVDGYEADDLIGTISRQAVDGELNGKLEVIIVSGDRDLLQLVGPSVYMLAPVTGITKMIVYNEDSVEDKFGIKPMQIIDYKALMGDASDGYPGVSGVGPKTAAGLIRKYASVEEIYKNLDEIKKTNEALAMKLAQGAEAAGLAKQLATIVRDAPINLKLEDAKISNFDMEKLKKDFEKLGFNSLLKRIFGKEERKDVEEKIVEDKKENDDPQLTLL